MHFSLWHYAYPNMPTTPAIVGVHLETVLYSIQISDCNGLTAYSLSKIHDVRDNPATQKSLLNTVVTKKEVPVSPSQFFYQQSSNFLTLVPYFMLNTICLPELIRIRVILQVKPKYFCRMFIVPEQRRDKVPQIGIQRFQN